MNVFSHFFSFSEPWFLFYLLSVLILFNLFFSSFLLNLGQGAKNVIVSFVVFVDSCCCSGLDVRINFYHSFMTTTLQMVSDWIKKVVEF